MELISRQSAIDAFNTNIDELVVSGKENADAVERYLNRVIDEIKQLPPIQPKRGRWLYCEDSMADCVDGYRCDQCGFFVPWDYQHKGIDFIQDYNFCPSCGAKMGMTT